MQTQTNDPVTPKQLAYLKDLFAVPEHWDSARILTVDSWMRELRVAHIEPLTNAFPLADALDKALERFANNLNSLSKRQASKVIERYKWGHPGGRIGGWMAGIGIERIPRLASLETRREIAQRLNEELRGNYFEAEMKGNRA